MQQLLTLFWKKLAVCPSKHLTYSTGPRGSRRLRQALAEYYTDEFSARELTVDNVFITCGLASAIDALAWATCNDGEGILVPLPLYNGFTVDILNRSNARVVGITYTDIEEYSGIDSIFLPDLNTRALEAALCRANKEGITLRALLISKLVNNKDNTHTLSVNSGSTVHIILWDDPPETLVEFASFCRRHNLHFISDEIYAKSVFQSTDLEHAPNFTSVLSLDLQEIIDAQLVHVLYGASKDFCANGLRLGAVLTQNQGLIGAISSIGYNNSISLDRLFNLTNTETLICSIFSWPSHILQDIWACLLDDRRWMQEFMAAKLRFMEENYKTVTSFLFNRADPSSRRNAGLYIWVDLGYLFVSPAEEGNSRRVNAGKLAKYQSRETWIEQVCAKHGVLIAPGSVYMPEEYGWFRITFTVGKQALQEGLKRFSMALEEVEAVPWQ
ncbi:aspartate aminotransferase [Cordyceps javanica]|nr:aspartate aminotransferase [Cordyceps javanica]